MQRLCASIADLSAGNATCHRSPMHVIHGLYPDIVPASVLTLGMFDGVHCGHQALLTACRRHADRIGVPAVVLTYEPHPLRVLRPDAPLRLLTPLSEKIALLERAGMDIIAIADFTRVFSLLPADAFLHTVLTASFHPRLVVAGYRTTFGHARAGTAALLRDLGHTFGFAAEIVEPVAVAGGPVSSTRIRQCLEQGEVTTAAALLGYAYHITGTVIQGDHRGRQLGIPTANLEVHPDKLVPADGIYAVDVCAPGVRRRGVMHIGERPVFARPRTLEVHLLDFDGDLYQQPLTVTFLARLRHIERFPDVAALVAQMHADIARARQIET